MSRLAAALVTASMLVPGAVVAAGCGSEEVEKAAGVDVAQAAQRTAAKGTARMAMTIRLSGAGLPRPVTLEADGVTALDKPAGRITMDLGAIAQSFGAPVPGGLLSGEVLFAGSRLNVKVPSGIPGIPTLPRGASWVQLDLEQLASAIGLDADGLGALLSIEPSAQLKVLDATPTLKKVGTEKVGGADTTHYRGTYTLDDYVEALPAAQQKTVRDALEKLEKLGGESGAGDLGLDEPVPVDLWVDDEGIARKLTSTAKIPGQQGLPGGTLDQVYELSDFGAELDVSAPPKDDTYEATDALTGLLKQSLTKLGGSTAQIG